MAVYAQTACTLSTITDVTAVYTYYYLASSTITSNMAPQDNVNPPDETHDAGSRIVVVTYDGNTYTWRDIDPSLSIVDNVITTAVGQLYYIECVKFSDGTYDWGPLMTSSTYAAAKAAYNLSSQALSQANTAAAATALLGGHFIYKSTTSVTGLTPPSANVVQTIEKNNIDVTDDPTQWGYNTHIGANGIKLRLNETDLIHLSENGLNIYKDGESVAVYGDDSRIGKEDGAAFYINDNSLLGFYMKPKGNNEYDRIQYFTVNSNGIFYGADTDDTRTITRQELNGELQSITNKIELINNDMQTNIDLIQSNLNSINSDLYDSAPALSIIKDATNMVNNYLGNGKVLNWNSSNSTLQLTNTIFNIQMLSDRIVFQKNNQTAAAIRDDVSFHINDAVINNTERLGTNFQWVVGTNRLTLMRI